MNTTATESTGFGMWLGQAEAWLDARGKSAWIALMVLSFIVFWPLGLALLAYMIWGKRMFGKNACNRRGRGTDRLATSSGNTAFDSYREETLRRLEEEQLAFAGFLQRLREARDKTEFDAFMDERMRNARGEGNGGNATPDAPRG